tara:strand:+ start:724 stop:1020 length:297 start_codon:yes stop_codon:yes gene_type:complete
VSKKENPQKMILGIVFISGGSTFYSSSDTPMEEMASIIVKRTVKDWKHLFKFKKNALWPVHFYDISGFEGWNADYAGKVTDLKSKKEAPFLETLKVVY